jgi:tetratricopeptide (TPR) repeat protein
VRKPYRVLQTCAAAALLLSAGCGLGGKKTDAPPDLPVTEPPVEPPVVWEKDQTLEAASTAFAKTVEKSINRGDPRFMQAHMDYAGMLKAAADAWKLPASSIAEFEKKFATAGMPATLAQETGRGAAIKLLRLREVDGQWRAMLRLLSRDGLQYHELYLAPDAQRTIKIVDACSYLSGTKASETLRHFLLPLAVEKDKAVLDKITPAERAFAENVSAVAYLQSKMLSGDYTEALKVYGGLPEAVKADPEVAQMRFACARKHGKDDYLKAIEDFRTRFGGKGVTDLLLIKYYFVAEREPEGLEALDRLDKAVGGDGMLDYFRAKTSRKLNDAPKAKALAHKALEADPTLDRAYYLLFDYSLEEKDYTETTRLLDEFEKHVPQATLNLEQEKTFADFLKSKEYEEWMKRRALR